MAGLVPAIHVFLAVGLQSLNARHKAGHDELVYTALVSAPSMMRLVPEMRLVIGLATK